MDLKELLKKTQNKIDQKRSMQITQVSIALDDRPYDDLVNHESKLNGPKEDKKDEIKKEASEIKIEKESKKDVEKVITTVDEPLVIEVVNAITKIEKPLVSKEDVTFDKPPVMEKSFPVQTIQDISPDDYSIIFLKLSGIERKLVNCFFEFTKKNNSMSIGPISRDQLCSIVSTNVNTFKRALRNLKDKSIILTKHHKTGKGGWAIYEFNTKFYNELISGERIRLTLKEESLEYSVQSYISRPDPVKNISSLLPDGWDTLEFEDLAEKGFTKNHLIQIHQDQEKIGKIFDAKTLQYSIDAFRYDLEHNLSTLTQKSHTKSPVTFFTQILSKGRPYNSFTPEKFKTPQEIEFLKYRERMEKTKKDFEELKSKFFDSEYQTWYQNLLENEMDEIFQQRNINISNLPATVQKTLKTKALQEYFSQYVWIDIQKELHKKLYL